MTVLSTRVATTTRHLSSRYASRLHSNKIPVHDNKETSVQCFEQIPCKKVPFVPRFLNLMLNGGPKNLHNHCDRLHQELGPIFREQLGLDELVFLADTRLIQTVIANEGNHPHHSVPGVWLLYNDVYNVNRGLFFQVGDPWAKLRKAFNRVLLAEPKEIAKFSYDLLDISKSFIQSLYNKRGQSNATSLDLKSELCKWSMETTGVILFGERMGCVPKDLNEVDPKADLLVDSVTKMFKETSKFQVLPCKMAYRFNLDPWVRFSEASHCMLQTANYYARKFISKAREPRSNISGVVRRLIELDQLADEEISASIVDLIIAASDTTSNIAQWSLYLLGKHPDIQTRLRAEARAFLSEPEQVDWNDLRQRMPFLNAFIKETSRLYPTAPFLARTLNNNIVLDGYEIPAGKPIVFSLYTTSRMEKYFDKPLEFIPKRWMRDQSIKCPYSQRDRSSAYASLPFGVGSRMCVGRKVAELELSLLIISVVLNYNLTLPTDLEHPNIQLQMTLGPDKPIRINLEPLTHTALANRV